MPAVTWALLYVLSTIIFVTHVLSGELKQSETIATLYEKGTQAYLEERFPECTEKLEQALAEYRKQRRNTQNCRLKCKQESEASEPLFPVDIEDLRFFEKNIKNTLCLINCKIRNNGNNDNIDSNLEKIFEERRPYEYLHLCYYKVNDKQKAASAAFTFLVVNPEHKVMKRNLEQYLELPEVDVKDLVNFEAKDYVYLYAYGVDAYDKKNWDAAINNMEESLVSYLHSEDGCRAQCEGPFDPGWYPDFVPSIANHFTYVLKCKQDCKKKLGKLNAETYDDFLPSHYNYLQFAYFKKGNLAAACEAVASFLLLVPNDPTMLDNLRYYQGLPKVQENYFTPREEVIRYSQRDTYEKRILHYIKNEFKFSKNRQKSFEMKRLNTNYTNLGTEKRFYVDGLVSLDSCKKLLHITTTFMSKNDGYSDLINVTGMNSPHTTHEAFEGITIGRMTFLYYIGIINSQYLQLVLELTEAMRSTLIEKFEIKNNLYFSFTHLVCRSSLSRSPVDRADFSHMIHADNCNLLGDKCEKKSPAFHWRDYSAILYLNENFEGGEFIFASDSEGRIIQDTISPRCGRMVAFSSGSENLHGVKAVKSGRRCALAVWFTFNQKYRELDRDVSQYILDNNITIDQYSNIDIGNFFHDRTRS